MSETASEDSSVGEETIAVVGAGTMGHGIAVAYAVGGCTVRLYDADADALDAARAAVRGAVSTLVAHDEYDLSDGGDAMDAITYATSLSAAVDGADLVIEAVTEDREVKSSVLADVEAAVDDGTVIATNTSSLSITELGSALDRPERFLGTHWFHPPHIVPVVEVVKGEETADWPVDAVTGTLDRIGKRPVVVEKDIPGFIGNRIQSAMAHEAWALLNDGVASAEDIDTAIKGTFGFRLPALGVFEKGDHSGLDIHAKVLDELLDEIDRGTTPSDALTRLADEGRHGVKSGRGVYDWRDVDVDAATEARDRQLLSLLAVYHQRERPASTDDR